MKKWFMLAVVFVGVAAIAASYTNMYSAHLWNSLIDNTPIGSITPNSANFTTVTASGGFTGGLNGNATSASSTPWAGITGRPYPVNGQNWYYSAQSGQPAQVWGTNDGTNMYVWNPANFTPNLPNLRFTVYGGTCAAPSTGSCTSAYAIPGGGYADANYIAVCTLISPYGYPNLEGVDRTSSNTITVHISTGTANQAGTAGAAGVSCMFEHN